MEILTLLRKGIGTTLLAVMPAIACSETFSVKVDGLGRDGRFATGQVYNGFGCRGENVSPHISWSHVPSRTKSIVVTMFDPDAPTRGLGWTHWSVVNIPPSVSSIEMGASGNARLMPAGALETLTDFGESKYGGPCPPQGESHRYVVTVFALSVPEIDAKPTSGPALVAYQLHGNTLAEARFVAKYYRPSR
ncbi:PEBP family protein [Burkholderia sp. HI2761]|uniref:YbhB/YbcL family Raf kinase inhibitor-like protein n=1 Tax=Burkholderia TaxID=32008 RepID=UPI0009B86799|nr:MULTISPECIES: YbhB/YbcL family Raf kinase inhibitor-like protein [Burkholderia]MPV57329.1 YbhB/YbcL family Raf kinase inhibitor-like protein [Burkholderia sp. BE24]OXJ22437.1 PEBP family protein [Burkholderia sp. HI2761]